MLKESTTKKIKLNWLTICPLCGKSHVDIWAKISDIKKKIYECKCPEKKEVFEIELKNI